MAESAWVRKPNYTSSSDLQEGFGERLAWRNEDGRHLDALQERWHVSGSRTSGTYSPQPFPPDVGGCERQPNSEHLIRLWLIRTRLPTGALGVPADVSASRCPAGLRSNRLWTFSSLPLTHTCLGGPSPSVTAAHV